MSLEIKRIYEPAEESDGKRILVDRLWPRGIKKEEARLDGWLKDIAPSPELRIWFAHQKEKFDEFTERYREELDTDPPKQEAVEKLLDEMRSAEKVTLLYGAKSISINHAAVLQRYMEEKVQEIEDDPFFID